MGIKEEVGIEVEKEKVGQEQVHGLLFNPKIGWQSIIYDLINSEQLDPWDIDLSLLANKYLEKIKEFEEASFFVSSQVLLAAAFLLRLKSEILLNEELKSLDDILMGRNEGEKKKYGHERIELDEDIPGLVPRTPLPRFRKVSLEELMSALGNAIKTENRRIQRVILNKQQEIETSLSMPKKQVNLKEQIDYIYSKLLEIFKNREERFSFSELAGNTIETRVATFGPLLYLDSQHKVWLEQDGHCEEIWILLKHLYEKNNASELERLKKDAQIALESDEFKISQEESDKIDELEKSFEENNRI